MTSAPDPATGRTSAARERLLRTASQIFYSEGIHAVGVDRIVAQAQVTRATFYRHFPGKEDLVLAYLHAQDDALRARLGADPQGPDEAAALLRAMVEAMGDPVGRDIIEQRLFQDRVLRPGNGVGMVNQALR